jgi:hypothetical protein
MSSCCVHKQLQHYEEAPGENIKKEKNVQGSSAISKRLKRKPLDRNQGLMDHPGSPIGATEYLNLG